MKRWLILLWLTATLAAADNSVSAPEAADGWLLLFDGESLFGWTPQAGGRWSTNAGVLTPSSDSGNLQSNSAFSDFWLKFDYISARADADCAVYLRAAVNSDPAETGYALELGDSKSDWPAGSIVDHFKAEAVHPAVNQWHSLEASLEADHITIKLDGRQVVDGKNARSRAGVISLACSQAGRMQFRNLKLNPLAMKALFNGTDLSGWKAVGPAPPKKEGMLKKVIPIGGGKPKEAKWSVAQGAIHAEGGEGQLESTAMYDDFVVQLQIRLNSKKGDHPKSGVFFRGDAGQLFSGYDVTAFHEFKEGKRSLADNTGGLKGLQSPRKAAGADNQYFLETIAARGRHVEVWIDGYPVTDFQDTRAEGTAPQKAARTAAGTISLASVDDKSNLDFRNIQIAQLPKTLGKGPAEATAIQPPPAAIPAAPPAPAPSGPPQIVFPPPDPNKPKVQQLMAQAINSNDPQQQKAIYGQILELDPSNPMAASGYQQAEQKIDAANSARAQQQTQQQQQQQIDTQSQAQAKTALQAAQTEFLAGDLDAAHTHIGVANKLVASQPEQDPLRGAVVQLRDRIESAIQARTRLRMIWGTAGIAFVFSLIAAWWVRRGAKHPYLEIINGLEKGKKFNLDQEVMHIGAVAEDGGNKNEIVVQDLERSISRFHCEIHQRTGQFFLIDCGSANGTRLDGHSIPAGKPFRIKSGARIELAGNCALRLGFEKRAAN
jgi:Domain of Unknown Function (DUF1080)/FHA domain